MDRVNKRKTKHFKIRKRVIGTTERPRLAIFRSNQHIYVQLIDDSQSKTLAAESDLKLKQTGSKSDKAYAIGKKIAEKALKKGIKAVVFDRGGFLYHGRVEKVATGAREGGLKF